MSNKNSAKIRLGIFGAWLIAGIVGDELFGWIYFGEFEKVFGFNLNQPWWWIYQVVIALIFLSADRIVAYLANRKSNSIDA